MWKLLLLCFAIGMIVDAEGARKRYASTAGYAGAGASAGGGAGYFGTGFDDFDYGYAPDFGFIDPFQFHQQLTAQILAEHAANNNAIASTYAMGPATATADASSLPDDNQIQAQIAQHQGYYRHPGAYGGGVGYKGNRYAPNYAAASGSIGPGGYHQSAFISPANPAIPNISNRFGTISSPGGYKGVSVSSFASSSDINGHKTGYRGAQTTINDNGKVTTYRVHS